ncbi:3-oxoacyl-ACP reductase FabG [Hydromonas duriensis]|uniref:3-oxoacyl-[acyl-carrier protein] reductase n=1 Tax=Hydromonas duriensis TaxID=1527608 RepID=A0A4R6Y2H7_9BURK|nr:3-oxoacyl-ACP reductase FabG [Hydromonas duriensis]TDR30740.1 3-oxoacyl-[acyl-carrier protein] reductase [Hydromonas duriensis]
MLPNPNQLDILVTGSTRGIGFAIAQRLLESGYGVVLHARKQSAIESAMTSLKSFQKFEHQIRGLCFDVTQREDTEAKLLQDIEQFGCYYGVVCNAGIAADNAFPAMMDKEWDDVIDTNLHGFYNVLRPLVLPMIQRRSSGRIVTLSSVSGMTGNRGQVNYSAAKAGIIGATKALAVELAKRKITVNCVAPGLIDTDMVEPHVLAEALKIIPMQRMGTTAEVAGLVNFLMSDEAAYITRQVISVNGGMFG